LTAAPLKARFEAGKRVKLRQGATFSDVNVTVKVLKDLEIGGLLTVLGNVRVQGTITVEQQARLGGAEIRVGDEGKVNKVPQGTVIRKSSSAIVEGNSDLTNIQGFDQRLEFIEAHYLFEEDLRSIGDHEILIKGDLLIEGNLKAKKVFLTGKIFCSGGVSYGYRSIEPKYSTMNKCRNLGA
jgi:cytoskeletal protein CcmA (bactofilin family)